MSAAARAAYEALEGVKHWESFLRGWEASEARQQSQVSQESKDERRAKEEICVSGS